MGKPTGFMEVERELPRDRSPLERVKDWEEFHLHMGVEKLRDQGSRCMDCGVPFCHTGDTMSRSDKGSGCPINNLIPEWNDLVYRGLWEDALERLHKTNNFPEFTGRVCPAPCEGACVLGINEPPVTIKNIEAAIVDHGFASGTVLPEPPERRTGRRVAVVGSGPAGLSCAAQLNRAGHWVTVYERADRIGGLLMYGIPNMKLDKAVVTRRLQLMEAEGVQFVTNTEIGRDIPAPQLIEDFDAVVLCGGATKGRDMPVEGREFNGVHFAMEFLTANTKSLMDSGHADGNYISAKDRHVIVIGGGGHRHRLRRHLDAPRLQESDAVRNHAAAARRARPGQSLARVAERLPARLRPGRGGGPLRRGPAHLPGQQPRGSSATATGTSGSCTRWGSNGRREPAAAWGRSRSPGPRRCGRPISCCWRWGSSDRRIRCFDQLDVERDERSNARAEHDRFATSVEGVFAAGDMRRGQSLVVWAINEGRGAARECEPLPDGDDLAAVGGGGRLRVPSAVLPLDIRVGFISSLPQDNWSGGGLHPVGPANPPLRGRLIPPIRRTRLSKRAVSASFFAQAAMNRFLVVLCMATAAEAHSGNRLYPFYELTDEMLERIDLHDGFIDEWYEIGEPSMTLLDFKTTRNWLPADPSNLDFSYLAGLARRIRSGFCGLHRHRQ